jgi:hypothetical protein
MQQYYNRFQERERINKSLKVPKRLPESVNKWRTEKKKDKQWCTQHYTEN